MVGDVVGYRVGGTVTRHTTQLRSDTPTAKPPNQATQGDIKRCRGILQDSAWYFGGLDGRLLGLAVTWTFCRVCCQSP